MSAANAARAQVLPQLHPDRALHLSTGLEQAKPCSGAR